jgi:hypothetical protein
MALVDIGKGKLATSLGLDSARAPSVARFLLFPVVAALTSEGIQIRLELPRATGKPMSNRTGSRLGFRCHGDHASSAQHLFPRWHFVKETVQLQTDLDPL